MMKIDLTKDTYASTGAYPTSDMPKPPSGVAVPRIPFYLKSIRECEFEQNALALRRYVDLHGVYARPRGQPVSA